MNIVGNRLHKLVLVACCLIPALSNALPPTVREVDKIPLITALSTWQAIDERHVVLSLSPTQSFLLTLARDCHSLVFASRLGVSASNNTVYAGFDYITADGESCTINSIERLEGVTKSAGNEPGI